MGELRMNESSAPPHYTKRGLLQIFSLQDAHFKLRVPTCIKQTPTLAETIISSAGHNILPFSSTLHLAISATMSIPATTAPGNKSAPRFPSFPKLPFHVREQIWEDAIFTDRISRVHYYMLYNIDDKGVRHSEIQTGPGIITRQPPAIDVKQDEAEESKDSDVLNWSIQAETSITQRPGNIAWARANRFRCHWDGGLRTACSESRFIYLRVFEKLVPHHGQLSLARARDGNDEVQIHVNTLEDILCLSFSPDDFKAAAAGLQWDVLLASTPFFRLGAIDVVNIAFEFDPSWNEGLPDLGIPEMPYEASPRGLCAKAVMAWANGELPRKTRIWLIDRTWKAPPEYFSSWLSVRYYMASGDIAEQEPKIFIDNRLAYIECKEWKDDSPEFAASAVRFVWQLRKMWDVFRREKALYEEEKVVSSWKVLPWDVPFCVAALRETTAQELVAKNFVRW
jgi:2EXR family protein